MDAVEDSEGTRSGASESVINTSDPNVTAASAIMLTGPKRSVRSSRGLEPQRTLWRTADSLAARF